MKVFSFCLYGTEPNYYTGLLENIKIIQEFFPDFEIYVYKGICDPSWIIEGATVIETGKVGAINMFHRFLPIQFGDIGFIRDTDSRITERDRWCIQEFLKSDKKYHIIRDHYYHISKVMGGLFGWKQSIPTFSINRETAEYSEDEFYLAEALYSTILPDVLVHTNTCGYFGETTNPIEIERVDIHDFIGNVIWDSKPRFGYFENSMLYTIHQLRGVDQFKLIKWITDPVDPFTIPYTERSVFLDIAYSANYYVGDISKAQYWLGFFEFAEISQGIVTNAAFLFTRLGRIVASFDPTRDPAEDEVVIVYGNYPDGHLALPSSRKVFRHISLFNSITHDVVEYNPAWEPVDIIYILNLEERVDRYYETLLALAAVGAPLHRVHHYKAKKDDTPAYIGATQNHVDVMTHFCESSHERCLILEDDFIFIDEKKHVWASISEYFKRDVDHDICFLSISKIGERQPHDALLSKSLQPCTTSSGYFLRKPTAKRVLETALEGLNIMKETGNHHEYCIDRYWAKLPNIMFFRKKLGFQRPAYSNLTRSVVAYLD